jgi:hypothetical protein
VTEPDATDVNHDDAANDGFWPHTSSRHGRLSGYDRHRARGEAPCADCRRARTEYDAAGRRDKRARDRARYYAVRSLIEQHRAEYDRLYDVEYRSAVQFVKDELAAIERGELSRRSDEAMTRKRSRS